MTCLVMMGVVAGLFAFSDYFSDYIAEKIPRSEIQSVGGCYGWSQGHSFWWDKGLGPPKAPKQSDMLLSIRFYYRRINV